MRALGPLRLRAPSQPRNPSRELAGVFGAAGELGVLQGPLGVVEVALVAAGELQVQRAVVGAEREGLVQPRHARAGVVLSAVRVGREQVRVAGEGGVP